MYKQYIFNVFDRFKAIMFKGKKYKFRHQYRNIMQFKFNFERSYILDFWISKEYQMLFLYKKEIKHVQIT